VPNCGAHSAPYPDQSTRKKWRGRRHTFISPRFSGEVRVATAAATQNQKERGESMSSSKFTEIDRKRLAWRDLQLRPALPVEHAATKRRRMKRPEIF
jgi:hypothetical protein